VFVTDELGRTTLFHTDNLGLGVDARPDIVNSTVTGKVGRSGGPGYDGGHLDGSQFGGGSEFVNLTPQAAKGVNRAGGDFYTIETKWRTALDHNGTVTDVDIQVTYADHAPMTPTRFKGQDYEINPKPEGYDVTSTINGTPKNVPIKNK